MDVKSRNPFGEMDVPEPQDAEVLAFAETATLAGDAADANAEFWCGGAAALATGIDGAWSSRWNGGADPTIAGDTPAAWKSGPAQARSTASRVFLLFSWDEGRRRGLLEAARQGQRLVGKYINLTNPAVRRPWVGLIVDDRRIDGVWTNGRLDFRR